MFSRSRRESTSGGRRPLERTKSSRTPKDPDPGRYDSSRDPNERRYERGKPDDRLPPGAYPSSAESSYDDLPPRDYAERRPLRGKRTSYHPSADDEHLQRDDSNSPPHEYAAYSSYSDSSRSPPPPPPEPVPPISARDAGYVAAATLVSRLRKALGIELLEVPVTLSAETGLNILMREAGFPDYEPPSENPMMMWHFPLKHIGLEIICTKKEQEKVRAALEKSVRLVVEGSPPFPKCFFDLKGIADTDTLSANIEVEQADGGEPVQVTCSVSYGFGKGPDYAGNQVAYLLPAANIQAAGSISRTRQYRFEIDKLRFPGGQFTKVPLPVYNGAVIFASMVNSAWVEHSDAKARRGVKYNGLEGLMRLLWATTLAAVGGESRAAKIKGFRDEDVKMLFAQCRPNYVRIYLDWSREMVKEQGAVSFRFVEWWEGKNGEFYRDVRPTAVAAMKQTIMEVHRLLELGFDAREAASAKPAHTPIRRPSVSRTHEGGTASSGRRRRDGPPVSFNTQGYGSGSSGGRRPSFVPGPEEEYRSRGRRMSFSPNDLPGPHPNDYVHDPNVFASRVPLNNPPPFTTSNHPHPFPPQPAPYPTIPGMGYVPVVNQFQPGPRQPSFPADPMANLTSRMGNVHVSEGGYGRPPYSTMDPRMGPYGHTRRPSQTW